MVCACDLRLGPSASQVLPADMDSARISELVNAVNLLRSVMEQPWAKSAFGSLLPTQEASPSNEMPPPRTIPCKVARPSVQPSQPAQPHEASSVKPEVALSEPAAKTEPAAASVPAAMVAQPAPVAVAKPAEVAQPAKAAEQVAEPAAPSAPATVTEAQSLDVQKINTSSHRNHAMRLARKMASMDEAECPNMMKLWTGNRKDWVYITIGCFFEGRSTRPVNIIQHIQRPVRTSRSCFGNG